MSRTIGAKHEAFTRSEFGHPTWGIVSKKFDNTNPIPHHLDWKKWEVYDINRYDNGEVHPSHYHTTAMGLYPWVTRDDLLNSLRKFDTKEYNGIRHLSPHVMMIVGQGFTMPNGVLHSPTDLVHHEVHVTMDEHFLAENLTLDGWIDSKGAFMACREQDYPKDKHGDWEYLVEHFDFEANQDPNFVKKNSRPPIAASEYENEGISAEWIVYGNFLGDQKCSILRIRVKPGVSGELPLKHPAVFHTNQGRGRLGALGVQLEPQLRFGKLYYERGFISQAAIDHGPLKIENRGEDEFVITLDFPQNAHAAAPGLRCAAHGVKWDAFTNASHFFQRFFYGETIDSAFHFFKILSDQGIENLGRKLLLLQP
jgi:hypothetical protein